MVTPRNCYSTVTTGGALVGSGGRTDVPGRGRSAGGFVFYGRFGIIVVTMFDGGRTIMPVPSELKNLSQRVLHVSVFVLGVVSGVAELADFSTGVSRAILQTLGIACLLYFVVRLWLFYFNARIRQLHTQMQDLNEKLTLQQAGHHLYLQAIERISDR
ncbi:hypothetical protein AB0M20_31385, partial [Actinoplanes sp. NPDC051633]